MTGSEGEAPRMGGPDRFRYHAKYPGPVLRCQDKMSTGRDDVKSWIQVGKATFVLYPGP